MGQAASIRWSATNGLLRRSSPNVDRAVARHERHVVPSGQSGADRADHPRGVPRGKSVRPIEPANSTSPTIASLLAREKTPRGPAYGPGSVDLERLVAERDRVAVLEPAVRLERLRMPKAEAPRLLGQLLDPEAFLRCGPSIGMPSWRDSVARPRSDRRDRASERSSPA
jgi:hypothetical protein